MEKFEQMKFELKNYSQNDSTIQTCQTASKPFKQEAMIVPLGAIACDWELYWKDLFPMANDYEEIIVVKLKHYI